ncbi:hypothetical protein SE17_04870 [Kouleothrix aurantiaca]|uniref:UspA domain-containing protein n=1 Tax=Kouleothrix aurantiaca TaxID=186479 RepID=A0A0P9DL69_9CHLR|nr:hypothetical protein SE17_04870 [Kouleothrix aurantiaca]
MHGPNGHANATRPDVTDLDLVVLANHRHNGPVRFWLGDITDALVYWRPAPTLVLRSGDATPDDVEPHPGFQRMLLLLDGSALAEQILVAAVALGKAVGPSIHYCTSLIPTTS